MRTPPPLAEIVFDGAPWQFYQNDHRCKTCWSNVWTLVLIPCEIVVTMCCTQHPGIGDHRLCVCYVESHLCGGKIKMCFYRELKVGHILQSCVMHIKCNMHVLLRSAHLIGGN